MKLTVEVDLSDFYGEEDEGTLSKQIKDSMIYDVKYAVIAHLKDVVNDEVQKQVQSKIESELSSHVEKMLSSINTELKFQKNGRGEEKTISEHVKEEFESHNSYNGTTDHIKRQAEAYSDKLKEQYDMYFAAQVVSKMSDQGFLKEDVMKMLVETKDK